MNLRQIFAYDFRIVENFFTSISAIAHTLLLTALKEPHMGGLMEPLTRVELWGRYG